jgi:hypothetical protein
MSINGQTPYGKVLIGYPCREYLPCSAFNDSLANLETFPGVLPIFQARTGVLPGQRNRICREAQRVGADWVWMLDDDQLFAPDTLKKLLAHNVDAVIGIALRRKPPFAPLLYDRIDSDGGAHQFYLKPYHSGLIPIAGAGLGSLLIRREVLDAIGDPWFTFERSRLNDDDYAEDFPFYQKLREAGFQLHADLNVRILHSFSAFISAQRGKDGQWMTVMSEEQPFAAMPPAEDPSRILVTV